MIVGRDPGVRALDQVRGDRAIALLVAQAARDARDDPVPAATTLSDAAIRCAQANAYLRAERLATRAAAVLGDAGAPAERAPVLARLGWILTLRGKRTEGRAAIHEAERLGARLDPLGEHWPTLRLVLAARIPLEELERARDDALALCDRAADAGALPTLGGSLAVAAEAALRIGDWALADEAGREAIDVADDTGRATWLGFALSTRARLAAARGDELAARAAAAAALATHDGLPFAPAALGFLELGLGRADDAVDRLSAIEPLLDGSGLEEPALVPWAPDLVEAHARRGDLAAARRLLATLQHQARATKGAFAGHATARCRGLLDDDDFDAAFATALAHDERRPLPFERARTLLAYGRRLHRARRRAEARERLREARDGFADLGADAWVAQAESELRAAGARRRRARSDSLTPQEARVATAVGRGLSNREAAAELFLSPRTIEFHLRQIYRKLGIHSRTQLIRRGPKPQ
jgi:DNA-binding CsgD family transcriptional regulator